MKQANVIVHLSKEHNVHKVGVTPIQAMILVAEHHRNFGGSPILEPEALDKSATEVEGSRSDDDELSRLRGIYGPDKVSKLAAQVRNLPKTFVEAVKLGVQLKVGTGLGSQPNAATIAEVKLM